MFFVFSKLLDFFLSPLVWIIALMLIAIITKNQHRKRRSFFLSAILLIVFTNPFLINAVMNKWEVSSYKGSSIQTTYDVAIVLGGATRYYNSEVLRPVFGNGVDRLIQAVDLYHSKKVKKILLTGGSGYLMNQQIKEADLLRNVLLQMSIPDSDIIIERNSRNTYENAKMTADIIKGKPLIKSFLIITSAFHVRRTRACFEKQNIKADYFPVDEHSGKAMFTPDKLFMPNESTLNDWNLMIHEWTGFLLYKISGYV